ncbi:reverse transcriptase [Gossypium australe]|uniref:Reverse transcriptase n=1 Tax=Gossypium australe TaxID=47621 RepID=A0A5B6W820_9ROSI|nr:reverse transcriptase [Gossypium australe]
MRHTLPSCEAIKHAEKDKIKEDPPFTLALKAECSFFGRENVKLNAIPKKIKYQCLYTSLLEESREIGLKEGDNCNMRQIDDLQLTEVEKVSKSQEEGMIVNKEDHYNEASIARKRKLIESDNRDYDKERTIEDAVKRMKYNVQVPEIRRLRFLLKQHNPNMVFFMETKIDDKRMERIRRRSGFVNGIDVGAEGSRGGLCLAWREEIKVSLKTFSKNHIDILIEESNIHGDGDFNEILYSFEKSGGQPREERKMAAFRERARANWLQLGDKNSAFFHKYASARRRINTINRLESAEGLEVTDELGINETASNYFQNLFSSNGVGNSSYLLKGIGTNISSEINTALLSTYSAEEVHKALQWMGPTKAPGCNGFPALFFQKYWHIAGKDVEAFCLGVLNEGKDFEFTNRIDIVLIPISPNPINLVNFRPISLCTILYKIVAKTIANRLQNYIGRCIDSAQSVFVPGRLILDNMLIAYEILHTLRQKRTRKKGFMAVKLDMSKAYDRVEWSFLKNVILQMGFAENWVALVMKCVSTVFYAVNINENRGKIFQPIRGLQQGDPLSPYLFLICSEGLSALIRLADREGVLKGVKASRRGPVISHLLFADDCIFFGEATKERATFLKDILKQSKEEGGMGFRNMSQFNISLLAKQGWRIMNNVNSLVTKVLKAKYFPNGQFLNSRLGNSSSYTWKSIWAAKDALRKGLVWRVGRGTNISIDNDAWIQDAFNFRLSSEVDSMRDLNAHMLIDNNERKWKVELIKYTFAEEDVERILRIPLASDPHDDFLAWGVNMQHKKLVTDSSYPRCGERAETIDHLFRECPVIVEVWSSLLLQNVPLTDHRDFEQWLTWVFEQLNPYTCHIFCCALWAIWGDRNSRIHNKKVNTGKEIGSFIINYIAELDGLESRKSRKIKEIRSWRPPPQKSIKINFDGAFDGHNNISVSGIVVRNNKGLTLLSCSEIHNEVTSAFAVEALASWKAVKIGLENTWPDVIVEGDSLATERGTQAEVLGREAREMENFLEENGFPGKEIIIQGSNYDDRYL